MAEQVSRETVYVTHKDMTGILWRIIGALGGVCVLLLTAGSAAMWTVSSMFAAQGSELSVVRQDVAVIKVQVQGLTSAAVRPARDGDVNQAQYVLVQRPLTEAELTDKRIREMHVKRGNIDGEN